MPDKRDFHQYLWTRRESYFLLQLIICKLKFAQTAALAWFRFDSTLSLTAQNVTLPKHLNINIFKSFFNINIPYYLIISYYLIMSLNQTINTRPLPSHPRSILPVFIATLREFIVIFNRYCDR